MEAYFKYTQGESFTLNGIDYTGYVHLFDGFPYTGRVHLPSSQLLQSKDSFLSDIILSAQNINRTLNSNINIENIDRYISHNITIDRATVGNIIETLNANNLEIFKAQFISPIFSEVEFLKDGNTSTDYDEVSAIERKILGTSKSVRYYGLSATELDTRLPDDTLTPKVNVYSQIDPFSYSDKWKFLDSVISGNAYIDEENDTFRYFMSTETNSYTVSGSLIADTELQIVHSTDSMDDYDESGFSPGSYTYVDKNRGIIYEVNSNRIAMYDYVIFKSCKNLIRVNEISLDDIGLTINTDFNVSISKSFMVFIGTDEVIHIINIADNTIISSIDINDDLQVEKIYAICTRSEDDIMLILSDRGITKIDLLDYVSDEDVYVVESTDIVYKGSNDNIKLLMSGMDSNIFFIVSTTGIESRYIDNPKYPANISKLLPNIYGDIENGGDVVGGLGLNLLFLNDYIFDKTKERFNKIKIKFNSNKLKSNYPNIINVSVDIGESKTLVVLHFIGRIYTIVFNHNTVPDNSIDNLFDMGISSRTNRYRRSDVDTTSDICNKSTVSLTLNTIFRSIIEDTIDVYNLHSKISYSTDNYTLNEIMINDLKNQINYINLMIHSNEGINVHTLNRVITYVYNIQKKLADKVNSFAIA